MFYLITFLLPVIFVITQHVPSVHKKTICFITSLKNLSLTTKNDDIFVYMDNNNSNNNNNAAMREREKQQNEEYVWYTKY